ncbi:DUF3995 domain-containing protein [Yinghuangia soli]|uniref:DUF3995 domain-containing protein n=1 Tax=Yinghuangia soli TaxID=2908204 RepID=A0AA41Q7I0_9ACTN|nr:DUF3995 domain-containing protein [Yinghuangia soli]MCF2531774.1 DUF3995 domain-containing protein [Yinghuangia soli]
MTGGERVKGSAVRRARDWVDADLPARRRPVLSSALAAGLGSIGALHLAWGAGTTWPYDTEEEFARHLLGFGETAPPAWASLGVGAGLTAGAYLVLAAGGLVPRVGPKWAYRLGAVGLAGVLVGRGVLGPLTNSGSTPEYVRLDWRVYSPLCLVLGALALSLAAGLARPKSE